MSDFSFSISNNVHLALKKNTAIDFDRFNPTKFPHYNLFREFLAFMGSIGFYIAKNKRVDEAIRKYYFYGRYNNLEFDAQIYPAGFKFEFYQNIVFDNPNGGRYDFDKYEKMPYLLKLEVTKTLNKMKQFLIENGVFFNNDFRCKDFKFAEDKIKAMYANCCHKPQTDMNFNLSDLDGTTEIENYNYLDRDKKPIKNGEIKYFYDREGTLRRGVVYYDLNMNWAVIENKFLVTRVQNCRLFDPTAEDFKRRRLVPDRTPEEYKAKRAVLLEAKTKELERELRRRRKAVKNSSTMKVNKS